MEPLPIPLSLRMDLRPCGTTTSGMVIARLPASDLGGPKVKPPPRASDSCRNHPNSPCRQVNVATPERGQLSPAQVAEAGQEDRRPVTLVDRSRKALGSSIPREFDHPPRGRRRQRTRDCLLRVRSHDGHEHRSVQRTCPAHHPKPQDVRR